MNDFIKIELISGQVQYIRKSAVMSVASSSPGCCVYLSNGAKLTFRISSDEFMKLISD